MGRKKKRMSYTYQARVVESNKRFMLEVKAPLRTGANVDDDKGRKYRVAYAYKDGRKAPVVILAPRAKKSGA